ncbi:vacuolar protein sorting-associated protein 37a [Anaeramoeba ignava]|uniref:Vacuolar protein sorting-associated protein 37a n=1 Tax=Anaeramoeba ignava TaxID=1746090 RepID=A0A9Q0LCI6_ANAIG|nr:vacuolar protein sorting-associated protein 37a [Anaeramoeba ignava]
MDLNQLRQKQIDLLKQRNHDITTINNSEFHLPISLDNGITKLRVILPQNFPMERPLIKLSPPVNHAIVNENGDIINYEDLNKWTQNSDLGVIVYSISIIVFTEATLAINPEKPRTNFETNFQEKEEKYEKKKKKKEKEKKGNEDFPELNNLDNTQLQKFLNDKDTLKYFIDNLDEVVSMRQLLEQSRETNNHLAKKNLSLQDSFLESRTKFISMQEQVKKQEEFIRQSIQQQENYIKNFTPKTLARKCEDEMSKLDDESEEIAHKFLSKEIDHSVFLKEFLEKRKIYHILDAKMKRCNGDHIF